MEVILKTKLDDALSTLSASIESFAAENALGETVSFRLNLALDELVTNSILYSLSEVSDPWLRVRLDYSLNAVKAQLEDNGPAFDPLSEAPSADISSGLEDRPVGGLGVFLVTQFAKVDYMREDGKNIITLKMKTGDLND